MSNLSRPIKFGRYELLRRIGAGGMGEVFLSRLPGLGGADKLCVVKKILPHLSEDQGFVGRFVDEGKVVIHLSHGNIAQVFEMGEVDDQLFMAMEYVEGKTLAKVESRLREQGKDFPIELACLIGLKLCEGLGYAHRKSDPTGRPLNVVHRDISPSNVMLTYDGDLKIIDFGAALSTFKEEMTAPRVVIGNLSYMAPEHARKQHTDRRADLFSVGVVLWEMVSGQVIPSEGDHIERWKRAAKPSYEKPSVHRAGVPRELDLILMKALQVDLRERYQDAEMFRDDLQVALARYSPTTTPRALTAFMKEMFAAEHEAERRLIAELLAQPTMEPVSRRNLQAFKDPAPEPALAHGVASLTSEATPTPTDPPRHLSESTMPGVPPPAPQAAGRAGGPGPAQAYLPPSMRATQPGQPPVFGPDDEAPDDRDPLAQGAASLASPHRSKPGPPVPSSPAEVPELSTAPGERSEVSEVTSPNPELKAPSAPAERARQPSAVGVQKPRSRPHPVAKPGLPPNLWVVVGALIGFVVVVLFLAVVSRH